MYLNSNCYLRTENINNKKEFILQLSYMTFFVMHNIKYRFHSSEINISDLFIIGDFLFFTPAYQSLYTLKNR